MDIKIGVKVNTVIVLGTQWIKEKVFLLSALSNLLLIAYLFHNYFLYFESKYKLIKNKN